MKDAGSEKKKLTGDEQRVAKLLLNYIRNHPDAKHTTEGIARWWILQQSLEEELMTIESVIEFFVGKQILEKITTPDGSIFFKSNKDRLRDLNNDKF